MKNLSVVSAEYAGDYKIIITFSDNKVQTVDFEKFLINHPHPQHNKYKIKSNFKKFYIENGDIYWGKNWDLCFHLINLYKNDLETDFENTRTIKKKSVKRIPVNLQAVLNSYDFVSLNNSIVSGTVQRRMRMVKTIAH
eukprot:TRINITY_DN19868_c0_g1_i1.p3 TRINITY_DN19868_c0_g1~~TRINITY_DN19868_c0_g1_i1.p3  ORF type:complete len:138 (-),score=3.58 TRINITY_DN19868_c0_g1_i1:6-419(-)